MQRAKLTASDNAQAHRFGTAVSHDGNRIVVGAPFDSETFSLRGAVYVFEGSGSTWVETEKLVPEASDPLDLVGRSVALRADCLVTGAPTLFDPDSGPQAGSLYLYEYYGSTWQLADQLFAPDVTPGDGFGIAADLDEGAWVAGAIGNDAHGQNAGAAYAFHETATDVLVYTYEPSLTLGAASPNPFRETAHIEWSLEKIARVRLVVLDLSGRRVVTLEEGTYSAGVHRSAWNARDAHGRPVGAGVYFYRLETEMGVRSRKMVVLR